MLAKAAEAVIAPTFSLVINHTPWVPARAEAIRRMARMLRPTGSDFPCPFLCNDRDFRGTDWQESKVAWALDQWRWAACQNVSHCVFMTDDLELPSSFWALLTAMVEANPDGILGLLSNHPKAHELAANGHHWYRTNAWLVGPCYVMPRRHLASFLPWFEALPDGKGPGCKGYRNDDSSINEWVSNGPGGPRQVFHPLPTIIEHRGDLESTVGHGDEYSRERVSWRFHREATKDAEGRITWEEFPAVYSLSAMAEPDYWRGAAESPLLAVGG